MELVPSINRLKSDAVGPLALLLPFVDLEVLADVARGLLVGEHWVVLAALFTAREKDVGVRTCRVALE